VLSRPARPRHRRSRQAAVSYQFATSSGSPDHASGPRRSPARIAKLDIGRFDAGAKNALRGSAQQRGDDFGGGIVTTSFRCRCCYRLLAASNPRRDSHCAAAPCADRAGRPPSTHPAHSRHRCTSTRAANSLDVTAGGWRSTPRFTASSSAMLDRMNCLGLRHDQVSAGWRGSAGWRAHDDSIRAFPRTSAAHKKARLRFVFDALWRSSSLGAVLCRAGAQLAFLTGDPSPRSGMKNAAIASGHVEMLTAHRHTNYGHIPR